MGFSPPIQAIRPKPAAPPIPRNLCPANPATLRHSRRFRHSRESGNPDPKRGRNLSEKTDPPPPSFPRKRESRPQTRQESIGKNRPPATVIPAKAGIQTPTQQESIGKNRNPRRRHSRAGGNPDPKRGRNLSETAETERTGFPPARE
ncbi:putative phage associated protein [Neisseria meningitidis]|nr:putative phage associated protein [Neisseria meningitidis]CWT41527.1 putative phage associated protein [Neisseria meningitidis]